MATILAEMGHPSTNVQPTKDLRQAASAVAARATWAGGGRECMAETRTKNEAISLVLSCSLANLYGFLAWPEAANMIEIMYHRRERRTSTKGRSHMALRIATAGGCGVPSDRKTAWFKSGGFRVASTDRLRALTCKVLRGEAEGDPLSRGGSGCSRAFPASADATAR